MRRRTFKEIGVPPRLMGCAFSAAHKARKGGMCTDEILAEASAVLAKPEAYLADGCWGELAVRMKELIVAQDSYIPRTVPAPWRQ